MAGANYDLERIPSFFENLDNGSDARAVCTLGLLLVLGIILGGIIMYYFGLVLLWLLEHLEWLGNQLGAQTFIGLIAAL